MENYLSIAQKWADVKREILNQHNRVAPMIAKITEQHENVSGQEVPAEHIGTTCKLLFYPYFRGFAYTYASAWDTYISTWQKKPKINTNWEWTLSEAQEVLIFLQGMNEEEVKLLFSEWAEKYCQ